MRETLKLTPEVRNGLDRVLSRSLNEGNRKSKAERFSFASSEDAVTWTIFCHLQNTSALSSVCQINEAPLATFYWGAEHPCREEFLRDQLRSILTSTLGEDSRRFTEPDVIVVSPRWLVFVEVKHKSPNDRKPDYTHFARYLKIGNEFFKKPTIVATSGYYELTRNWIAGSLWARELGKNFRRINLGPEACRNSASKFAALLKMDQSRQFEFVAWTEFFNRIERPVPKWLSKYVREKGILKTNRSIPRQQSRIIEWIICPQGGSQS